MVSMDFQVDQDFHVFQDIVDLDTHLCQYWKYILHKLHDILDHNSDQEIHGSQVTPSIFYIQ